MDRTHMVYVRKVEQKRFALLTSKGTVTRKRIHAARFTEADAEKLAREINEDNVGEWIAEARHA